jgi:hypothetical protein
VVADIQAQRPEISSRREPINRLWSSYFPAQK